VGLFGSREAGLVRSLKTQIRLLLPADPGLERMLDAVMQYNPGAEPASRGRINVDGSLRLHAPLEVDAAAAAAAQLPPDITAACFVDWTWATVGTDQKTRRATDRRYQARSSCVLGGLAARFNGLSFPRPAELDKPLRADVYARRTFGPEELAAVVARRVPELAGAQPVVLDDKQVAGLIVDARLEPTAGESSNFGVFVLERADVPFRVEYWPPQVAAHPIVTDRTGARLLGILAPLTEQVPADMSMIVLRAEQRAGTADPGVARALGAAGLGLAAEAGGVCVDVFGFGVRNPDDLVIRR
jgi:hypothetical protein